MDYENETCESCKYFDYEVDVCHHAKNARGYDNIGRVQPSHRKQWERCEYLTPSLECRQVRALERLAECVHHHVGADVSVIAVADQSARFKEDS